jgi:hypothetical protein
MRLYELIDFTPKRSNIDKLAYSDRVGKGSGDPEEGHFAQVTQHNSPKRLNQVNKVGTAGKIGDKNPDPRSEVQEDGYLSYLKMVQEDDSQNPFFPRIHDLKIRKDPTTGNLTYNVKMEKLYSFNDIYDNPEMLAAMREHLFGDDGSESEENEILQDYTLGQLIVTACDGQQDLIKDPQFLEAVKKIDAVVNRYHHNWDMHSGNMMWRMTGTMPQLVITDPIA